MKKASWIMVGRYALYRYIGGPGQSQVPVGYDRGCLLCHPELQQLPDHRYGIDVCAFMTSPAASRTTPSGSIDIVPPSTTWWCAINTCTSLPTMTGMDQVGPDGPRQPPSPYFGIGMASMAGQPPVLDVSLAGDTIYLARYSHMSAYRDLGTS